MEKKLTFKNCPLNLRFTKSQNIKEFIFLLLAVNIKLAMLADGWLVVTGTLCFLSNTQAVAFMSILHYCIEP